MPKNQVSEIVIGGEKNVLLFVGMLEKHRVFESRHDVRSVTNLVTGVSKRSHNIPRDTFIRKKIHSLGSHDFYARHVVGRKSLCG